MNLCRVQMHHPLNDKGAIVTELIYASEYRFPSKFTFLSSGHCSKSTKLLIYILSIAIIRIYV